MQIPGKGRLEDVLLYYDTKFEARFNEFARSRETILVRLDELEKYLKIVEGKVDRPGPRERFFNTLIPIFSIIITLNCTLSVATLLLLVDHLLGVK